MKPDYAQLPIYHPSLRTFLAVGTFVETLLNERLVVARILSHRHDRMGHPVVIQQLFPCVGKSQHDNTIPFQQVFYSFDTVELPVTSIVDVCWVFSSTEADDMHNTLGHGSRHVHVVTSFVDGRIFHQQDTKDNDGLLLPFPDHSMDYPLRDRSYSLTIFSDLQRIVDEADKILNRSADINRGSGSTYIHDVTLDFFDRHTQQNPILTFRTVFRKRTDSGVITRVRRKKNQWKFYRFQTVEELEKLFSLFGPTIVVGNRTRRPPVDKPFIPTSGTTQRVVVPSKPSSEKFARHCGQPGVDLATDGYSLRLYIRYSEANIARDKGHGKNVTIFLERTYLHKLVDVPSDSDDDDESMDDRLT